MSQRKSIRNTYRHRGTYIQIHRKPIKTKSESVMCNQKICNANKGTKSSDKKTLKSPPPTPPPQVCFVLLSTAGHRVYPKVMWFVCQWDFVRENKLFLCVYCQLEELLGLGWGLTSTFPLSFGTLSGLNLFRPHTCCHSHWKFAWYQSSCVKKVLCPWCPLSPLVLTFSLCLYFGSVPWVLREGFDGNIPFRTEWSAVSHSLAACIHWLWMSECLWVRSLYSHCS